MKLTKYALLAACTVTLASCSSDEPANNAASDNQETATSTGFAQFDIKLPQASASRAIDSYQEGTADEYAVTNGKIIVFKEAGTEAEATFVCTAELLGMNWTSATTGEITTTSSTVAELSNINLTDASTYAAVIVLNYDNTFQFPSAGQTFGAWSKTPQNSGMILSKDGKSYLTMTNAAKYVSTSAEPAVLVQIDKSKIAQSESAISGSAATIHVQRATAKVTVITSSEAYTPTGAAYTSDKVTIDAWALDITNKTTYPVQVTEGLTTDYAGIWSEDRFFGGTQFARVFWAKDPNYSNNILDQETTEGNFNVINASAITSAPAKAYCLENTFDVNHMMQGQTTRVVLKGTYRPNGIPENENFYKIGSSTQLWSQDNLQKQVLAKAQDVLQNDTDVTVDLGTVATAKGFHALSEIDIKKADVRVSDDVYAKIATELGLSNASDKGIATYFEGQVYYIARIKHFGDADCPWNIGDPTYGGDNEKYLGRYGMVRNNWYELNVLSVSNPGSPDVPDIKHDTPDDENDYYIQVEVNVLAWAKRVQNVDL
ncbi:MAG: hypothetical protein C7K11_08505 [Candidatus Amulumruptor caecigallinarius]|nr:MAG: hypothetical protein C7K11_08505 [Candidatus Amulumruptor caecigallinarius]